MENFTQSQKNIIAELEVARKEIKTDDYSMSIGEIVNLYIDNEIKLDPAFQRIYRWSDQQKTKLIESILIGIPIPELFVAQKSDGIWHVVDGVQRLSTIYQLLGVLKNYEPLKLTSCKYLPSLENLTWEDFPTSTQREFKKSKIRINIILTENSDEAQFELFQRLNTGGTLLESQEIRNCLILMVSEDFFNKLNQLKDYDAFKECLTIKPHDYDKEYHMELILRMYMGYQNIINYEEHSPISSALLSDFIDKETLKLIKEADFENFTGIFKRTFDKLKNTLGKDSFLKYEPNDGKFYGSFNVSVFEMITTGISTNIEQVEKLGKEELIKKIKDLYSEEEVITNLTHGVKAISRFKNLTEFSRKYFA